MDIKKFAKRAGITLVSLATIYGTFGGNEGGLPPLLTIKNGKSGGINFGVVTIFEPGSEFYGINLSVVTGNRGGTINGLNLNVLGSLLSEKNNYFNKNGVNGLEASIFMNEAIAGNHFQFGIYNRIEIDSTKTKRGLLMNYHFRGRGK